MCSTKTPANEIVRCSRCGEPANPNNRWEHGWPLYGKVEVGMPAQAFAYLGGALHIAGPDHFQWWNEGHPAMTENAAQAVAFEWGNGYRFDSRGRYRLCYACQKAFLRILGDFFGIRQRCEEIAAELEPTS